MWARQECYRSVPALEYLGTLNLESGMTLYRQCRDICPFYDEVIKNRKFGIMHFVHASCRKPCRMTQVVIAGAGFDALGIEITALYPDVRVFEIDRENMDAKARRADLLNDGRRRNISFIEADLVQADVVQKGLVQNGWNPAEPTLLIFEGVSYYLPTEALQALVQALGPERILLEYLRPYADVADDRADIPRKVFGLISNSCGLETIGCYASDQIKELFSGMALKEVAGMMHLEAMRTGTNTYFPTDSSGWIEVCLLENI